MARPQNSPRGNFGKHRVEIGAADGLYFNDYSSSTALIDANSTGLKLAGALYLSAKTTEPITQNTTGIVFPDSVVIGSGSRVISGNTTGYLFTTEAGLPASDGGNYKWTFVVNSTGIAGIAVNTTGTTWKYCRVTSLINTT